MNVQFVFLTGRESLIVALGLVSSAADGLQGYTVVGATCDASHQAVQVRSVAFCISMHGCQGSDKGISSGAAGPGHVGHGLCDLSDVHSCRAARSWVGARPNNHYPKCINHYSNHKYGTAASLNDQFQSLFSLNG